MARTPTQRPAAPADGTVPIPIPPDSLGHVLTITSDVFPEEYDWIALPAAPPGGGGEGITEAEADARYVKLLGDSTVDGTLYITGLIEAGRAPDNDYALTNKEYVDGAIAAAIGGAPPAGGEFLPLTGGTLTGPLMLSRAPTDLMEAVNRGYVDTAIAGLPPAPDLNSYLRLSGGTMTGMLTLGASPMGPLDATPRNYVDETVAQMVFKGGDRMLGPLRLAAPQTEPAEAVSKAYVDTAIAALPDLNGYLPLAGGNMLGPLRLAAPQTEPQEAVSKAYVDDALAAIPPPTGFLPLAGGTLTGPLNLAADPTADAQASTKRYVDGRIAAIPSPTGFLPLSGGTMTGLITLSGPPTANLHAATKAYVDSATAGSDVTAWQGHTAAGLWNTRSNINIRLINGGANIQVRALLDPNTRPLTTAGSVAFILPITHRPRWDGSTVCAGPRQTGSPNNLDTIGNVSWFASTGEVRACAIFNTNNWVPAPQWILLDIVIPRT